jgi:hypothetical protein
LYTKLSGDLKKLSKEQIDITTSQKSDCNSTSSSSTVLLPPGFSGLNWKDNWYSRQLAARPVHLQSPVTCMQDNGNYDPSALIRLAFQIWGLLGSGPISTRPEPLSFALHKHCAGYKELSPSSEWLVPSMIASEMRMS